MAGATTTLRARQGDTLDLLLWRDAGLGPGHLTRVRDANPGLANLEPVLPIGTSVTVPGQRTATDTSTALPIRPLVQLWS